MSSSFIQQTAHSGQRPHHVNFHHFHQSIWNNDSDLTLYSFGIEHPYNSDPISTIVFQINIEWWIQSRMIWQDKTRH